MIIKKILDIDNPTRSQIKKALDNHKLKSKLVTPLGTEIKPCGMCGKHYSQSDARYFYGELFCKNCVIMCCEGGAL